MMRSLVPPDPASAATDTTGPVVQSGALNRGLLNYLRNFKLASIRRSISSCCASSSNRRSRIRVYGPRELEDEFHMFTNEAKVEAVLRKIQNLYSQANLSKDRLDSGYCCCLGLLDPVTNIHVNAIIYDVKAAPPSKGGEDSMAQRSLDGLVTFLTCIFPYLPDEEAVEYLDATNLDALVAARLIVKRRGLRQFDVCSATTVDLVETALRCAAAAAQHPDPQLLVSGWKSISAAGLVENLAISLSGSLSDANVVIHLIQTPENNLELQESWELAKGRLERRRYPIGKGLPPVRAAMKRMLLAMIHGFYLKALGSLPVDELTNRYHRSLLLGGYCYGPLDPVENIIINTIWYEQNFPSRDGFKTFLISTSCLWQVAARSMYALISFLCTRYPGLTPDLALQRLLMAGGNLRKADPNLVTPRVEEMDWSEAPQIGSGMDIASLQKSAVRKRATMVTVPEAYVAAATAVFQPNPAAHSEFLASPDSVKKLEHIAYVLLRFVRDGIQIPTYEFQMLCTEVLKCHSSAGMLHQPQEPELTEINESFHCILTQRIGRFWGQHSRVFIKVKVALDEFNKNTASNYKLHVICGVNELVCGPHFCPNGDARGYNPWTPHKYNLSHANFLATTIEDSGNETAKLFFVEFDNHGSASWCVPIAWPVPFAERARCIYCENESDRIVHPASHRGAEFELYMNRDIYTNDYIIRKREDREGVEDDAIYTSYRVRPDNDNDAESARWRPHMPTR